MAFVALQRACGCNLAKRTQAEQPVACLGDEEDASAISSSAPAWLPAVSDGGSVVLKVEDWQCNPAHGHGCAKISLPLGLPATVKTDLEEASTCDTVGLDSSCQAWTASAGRRPSECKSDAGGPRWPPPVLKHGASNEDFGGRQDLTAPLMPPERAPEGRQTWIVLDFPLEDLVLKPWRSWEKTGSYEERRQRMTHVVLYYMIWWITIPIPWAVYPTLRPLPIAFMCMLLLASNNHWRDVRYGEWRHMADATAVAATFVVYFWYLFADEDLQQCLRLVIPIWPLCLISVATFLMAWWRHLHGFVEEGMVYHLLFRYLGTWILVYTQAYASPISLAAWCGIVWLYSLFYWLSARWLWVHANRLLG